MIFLQGFQISDQHLVKYISLDRIVHADADLVGKVCGCLAQKNITHVQTDKKGKGAHQQTGLVTGDDIHHVTGDEA